MEELYRSYLSFLRSLEQGLGNLTELAEKKLDAARKDDLTTLNELLNQEQAQALNFRGLEQARDKLLPQLGLVSVPLSQVPERFPAALQAEARQAVEALQSRYQAYRTAAGKTGRCWSGTSRRWNRVWRRWELPPPPDPAPVTARNRRPRRRPPP